MKRMRSYHSSHITVHWKKDPAAFTFFFAIQEKCVFLQVKIYTIMKKPLLIIIAFTIFYVTQIPSAEGQTFYDYALGEVSNTSATSVVRRVDDQRVIASYWDGAVYRLARVGPMGIISAKLDADHAISDIRIVGDDIFFCGHDHNTKEAFLGHATVSGIESMTSHIQIMNFGVQNSLPTITRLWRLAAYLDSPNMFRLVAVGDTWYSGTPSGVAPCLSGPCQSTLAVECTYMAGSFGTIFNRVFHDNISHYEYACDVVETNHYVAIVTFPAADELIIHRCDKTNVLASLDYSYTYYYYKVPPGLVDPHGCKMKEDTIAVASVFTTGTGTDNMQVRVIDLATMNMPCAQTFSLLDKDDVHELAYLPDIQKLVLLTSHTYTPLTMLRHTFFFLKPYQTAFPYNIEKIYDSYDHRFISMDRLASKHIIATGGDYWMMKDVTVNTPASTCYKIVNQLVKKLDTSNPLITSHIFQPTNIFSYTIPCNETYDQPYGTFCITNY